MDDGGDVIADYNAVLPVSEVAVRFVTTVTIKQRD